MCREALRNYVLTESSKLYDWAKCGEGYVSTVPTVLWAVGAAAVAHRLLAALFRRFLFRRVPMWEVILQQLLFVWMVIYSLHFWVVLVRLVKLLVEYVYDNNNFPPEDDDQSCKMMQQWVIWICGVTPLAVYIHTRPRSEPPPLMIWITTNPWQRREMGPYGYYLNRPLSTLQSSTNLSIRQQVLTSRRAFSDTKIVVKETAKKKRHSKSI